MCSLFLGLTKLEVMEQVIKDFGINIESDQQAQPTNTRSTSSNKSTISAILAKYSKTARPATSLEDELYRFSNVSSADENILQFWKANQKEYPKLAKIAKVLLGIPMTSSKSESAFSTAGCLIRKDRASITPYRIERTLFIHDNYDILKL